MGVSVKIATQNGEVIELVGIDFEAHEWKNQTNEEKRAVLLDAMLLSETVDISVVDEKNEIVNWGNA